MLLAREANPMSQTAGPGITQRPTVHELRHQIRDGGLRATPCRIALLRLMQAQTSPLCHSDVVERLTDAAFDQSTVYRALNDLTNAGLLHRMELGDHVWRYELPEKNTNQHGHPHHLCEICGRITCLSGITIPLNEFNDWTARVGSVQEVLLKGVCSECQSAGEVSGA